MPRLNSIAELNALREKLKRQFEATKEEETIITVGMGTCGLASGAGETYQAIARELAKHNITARVRSVGCIGMCVKEPLVDIQVAGQSRITYANILAVNVPRLIEEHILKGEVVQDWAIGIVPEDW
jgi:NADP-reducing hydrogenase subunit HndB